MSEKYPKVREKLIAMGWEFDEFRKKWTHY